MILYYYKYKIFISIFYILQISSIGKLYPLCITFGILLNTIGQTSGAGTTGIPLSNVLTHKPVFLQYGEYLNLSQCDNGRLIFFSSDSISTKLYFV